MPSPSAIAPITSPSPSPQPAQGVRPKAPAHPTGPEAPDAASGGFAALLGLLGDAMPWQEHIPTALPGAGETAGQAPAPAGGWDGATLVGQGLAALPAATAGVLPWGGQASALSGLLPPQLRRAGALVAETARMDSNALEFAEPGDQAERRPGLGGSAAARPGAMGAAVSAAAALAAAVQGQGKGARAPVAPAAAGSGLGPVQGAAPALPAPSLAEAAALPARLDGAAALAAALRSALDAQAMPAPALAALAPAAVLPGGEGAANGRSAGQGAGAGAGLHPPAAQAENAPSVPGSDASAPVPESATAPDAVAEQMAYWATDNLQNAQLTLSHAGRPVEVHVALDGQQAHVAFRSDQSDTRALLDAGTGQLRALLGQEGLVLSGVTVGSSSAQSETPPRSFQGRMQGQGAARPAAVAAAGTPGAMAERPRPPGVLTERKVDLFV